MVRNQTILTTKVVTKMFIAYDTKKGTQYAKLCTTKRNGTKTTKTYQNLGKVIDKNKGIYQNNKQGIFTYNPKTNTYSKTPPEYIPPRLSKN